MNGNLFFHIKNSRCPGKVLGKLSFVGHSLGGVIIRASLPYLAEY